MERKLKKIAYTALLSAAFMFLFVSCSDDTNDFVETAWNVENFSVTAAQWNWNSNQGRWEASRQLDYIDNFIYENGAVIGFVFIGTQDVDEVQASLPYSRSYLIDDGEGGLINFTETVGFEYSELANRVTFYIESSDSFQDEDAPQNYNFRIVMIW